MQFQRQPVQRSSDLKPSHEAGRPHNLFSPKAFPWNPNAKTDAPPRPAVDEDAPTKRIYEVLDKLTVRAEPHVGAKMKTKKSKGARVFSCEITMNGWLKLEGEPGYMATDMRGLDGLGVVALPVEEIGTLAVPEYQPLGIVCAEVVYKAGAPIAEAPNRKAKVLTSRRLGEYVFAHSQNFDGWLRVTGPEEGWVELRNPKAGEQLRLRKTRDVDIWALADVWAAARKTRQSSFGTREIQALKDLERRVLLSMGSHLAEVQESGTVDKLISEGLLTTEDLQDAASRVRCKLFANILLRTVQEEPIFRDLAPGFQYSEHPPLLPATQAEEDEAEEAHLYDSMAGWYGEGASESWGQTETGPAVQRGFFNKASPSEGGGLTKEDLENTQPFIFDDKVYRMAPNGMLFDPPNDVPIGVWNPASQQIEPAIGSAPGSPYNVLSYFGKSFWVMPDNSVIDPSTEEVVGLLNPETNQIEEIDPIHVSQLNSSASSSSRPSREAGPPLDAGKAKQMLTESVEKGEQLAEMGSFGEAADAFGSALEACRRSRCMDTEVEIDILRKRAACWVRIGRHQELLEDAEQILSIHSEDGEAGNWHRMASYELLRSKKTDSTAASKGSGGYDAPWKATGPSSAKVGSSSQPRMGSDEKACAYCGVRVEKPSICSQCKRTYYCGRTCQRNHWKVHKHECGKQGMLCSPAPTTTALNDDDDGGMEELD